MLKFFSAPIFAGVVLGILFPYKSLSLTWTSSLLLFLLLFLNTLAIDKKKFLALAGRRSMWLQCVLAQLLIFVFFPVIQTALALQVLRDQDFVFGVAVASLAPCALVNPFFANHRGGDSGLALMNVIISTLLCPFVTVPILALTALAPVFIDTKFLLLYLFLLSVVPLVASFSTSLVFPKLGRASVKWLPLGNSIILALLMFILTGSSLHRVPFRLLLSQDLVVLVGLFLLIDFGIFLALRWAGRLFFNRINTETLALSVASRNFAVTATIMLVFHPKAALPSAIGLMIHSLFFQWLLSSARRRGQPA